ncbi:MAG TPA: MFS transporter [Acidimicrobiia bacterium]|nr:MFS transporter [Acidimicrobiia bacterium]
MRRQMLVRLDEPVADVEQAARAALDVDGPPGGTLTGTLPSAAADASLSVTIVSDAAGSLVTVDADTDFAVPFFWWAIGPLVATMLKRNVRFAVESIEAALDGTEPPPPPKGVKALPDVAFEPEQAALLSAAAFACTIAGFGGGLFGQNSSFIADAFHASDARLSSALAITRGGVLVALVATALADRVGRRRMLLVCVAGICITNIASAFAPSLGSLTALQTLTRAFVNATYAVAAVAAVEEAPEGARAFSTAMLGLAGGFGFSFAVLTLPIADRGVQAWRVSFALSFVVLLMIPRLARELAETRRYHALVSKRITRGQLREVLGPTYGRRFFLLALIALLTNVFNAPSSQLTNRYLQDVRHFSGSGIVVLLAVTTVVPGILGVIVASRLAERGRRIPLASASLFGATAIQMVFFLVGGPVLWVSSGLATVTGAVAGIVLATLGAELFATEVRGTANGFLVGISVIGSAGGLVAAGQLSDHVGGIGRAIAICGIASLVAAFFVPGLPESYGRPLDELSPSTTERAVEPIDETATEEGDDG